MEKLSVKRRTYFTNSMIRKRRKLPSTSHQVWNADNGFRIKTHQKKLFSLLCYKSVIFVWKDFWDAANEGKSFAIMPNSWRWKRKLPRHCLLSGGRNGENKIKFPFYFFRFSSQLKRHVKWKQEGFFFVFVVEDKINVEQSFSVVSPFLLSTIAREFDLIFFIFLESVPKGGVGGNSFSFFHGNKI